MTTRYSPADPKPKPAQAVCLTIIGTEGSASRDDQRFRFERDRDRILYSSAFRRLSGITQVVRVGEADVFHTRQQHTLKVAQVGRRLAQICLREQPEESAALGVDPEVVEAACLAHDLGHPPFGHVGESVLDKKITEARDPGGFEGNAQSFRILTKLAVRFQECDGLDLTRATLAATLKYPWLRDQDVETRERKWGAYATESEDFEFARESHKAHSEKTAEAELMDWADDIAYSVHDLEDFHRCGAIPWMKILDGEYSERVVDHAKKVWFQAPIDASGRLREALRRLSDFLQGSFGHLLSAPYEGTRVERQELRAMTSNLIGRYIKVAKLRMEAVDGSYRALEVGQEEADEVKILKQITKDFVIGNPSLVAQQRGQQRILEQLFDDLYDDSTKCIPPYLPLRLRYLWSDLPEARARFACDCIASLTEAEAIGLHARLRGTVSGSVLDPIVR